MSGKRYAGTLPEGGAVEFEVVNGRIGKVAPTKEQLQDKWRDGQAGRMDADFTEDVGGPKLK